MKNKQPRSAKTQQISEIKALPSNPNLRRVRVGNTTVATLRVSDIESLRLDVGRTWTASLAQAVQNATETNKARSDAMKVLGRRALSRRELLDRLITKGHSELAAQQIVNELAADRWLDDRAYGQAVVDAVTRRKPASRELLIAKLQACKVDADIAEEIVRQTLKQSDPVAAATELARQRYGMMTSLPRPVVRRRIAGLLERRGFDEDVVADVLNRLGLANDDAID